MVASRKVRVGPRAGLFLLLQARPGKTHLSGKTEGFPLLTWHQKATEKCLEMGMRCDSHIPRVLGKQSLAGGDPVGAMCALSSLRSVSSSKRAESWEEPQPQTSTSALGSAGNLSHRFIFFTFVFFTPAIFIIYF